MGLLRIHNCLLKMGLTPPPIPPWGGTAIPWILTVYPFLDSLGVDSVASGKLIDALTSLELLSHGAALVHS